MLRSAPPRAERILPRLETLEQILAADNLLGLAAPFAAAALVSAPSPSDNDPDFARSVAPYHLVDTPDAAEPSDAAVQSADVLFAALAADSSTAALDAQSQVFAQLADDAKPPVPFNPNAFADPIDPLTDAASAGQRNPKSGPYPPPASGDNANNPNLAGANGATSGNPFTGGAPAPSAGGSPGGGAATPGNGSAQLNALALQGAFGPAASAPPLAATRAAAASTTPPPAAASPTAAPAAATSAAPAASTTTTTASTAQLAHTFGQLPLSFEANQGQADPSVQFLSHGVGYGLFLTPTAAVLALRQPASAGASSPSISLHPTAASTPPAWNVLQLQLVGANAHAQASGLNQLPGVSNYYAGSNPANWHTNIHTYGGVQYASVYQGIDLQYTGTNQRQLETTFVVHAGANANAIQLAFPGAASTSLDAQGNLILHTPGGDVSQHAPVAYQLNASGGHIPVTAQFDIGPNGQASFRLGAYDTSKTLYIDPVLAYSTYLGGSDNDFGEGIAVDSAGNAYLVGATASANFPASGNPPTMSQSAFVSELDPTGTTLLYSTFLGGTVPNSPGETGFGIAVDATGAAYITGVATDSSYPVLGAYQPTLNGLGNAVVTKLAPGGALQYSTFLGGAQSDAGVAIALDNAGNSYVTGLTSSPNFPKLNPYQDTLKGTWNAFVSELNSAGSALVFSTFLGGSGGFDGGNGIAVDANGHIDVGGWTNSPDFPTHNAFQGALGGTQNQNGFVTQFNPGGAALGFSTYWGGSGTDSVGTVFVDSNNNIHLAGGSLTTDSAGDIYVTGGTSSPNFPTLGAYQGALNGAQNAFVTELSPVGGEVFSTYLGGSGSDSGTSIAVDAAGRIAVTGSTTSSDFPRLTPLQSGTYSGNVYSGSGDAFISQLLPGGGSLGFSSYLGGGNTDVGNGIATDTEGNLYVIGTTSSTNFPTTNQSVYAGGSDVFVTKVMPALYAADYAYSVERNNPYSVIADAGVLANDLDPNGLPLTASPVSGQGPTNGSLTLNPDGSFTYTPNSGFTGMDHFQYTASDGVLTSNPATVTLTVSSSSPWANTDTYNVLQGHMLSVPVNGVLANDFDPDNLTITAVNPTLPQHGTLNLSSNGSFTYMPANNYIGPDSFQYQASDGSLLSALATVNITVTATDTPPTAANLSYTLAHDTSLSDSVLSSAADSDNDALMAMLVSGTGPTKGTLTLNLDGSFTYTPAAGYFGTDSFQYKAFDGTSYSNAATVTLTITNDAPTAVNDSYSVLASGMTTVTAANGVLANDTDGENDPLTASLVTQATNGTVMLNGDGSFTFRPGSGFTGTDSFTYKVSDGVYYSSPATVTLTVGPVAAAQSYGANHDTPLTVDAPSGVLSGAYDADGDTSLTASPVNGSGPTHGSLTAFNSDGSFTYTPDAHYTGPDMFSFTVSDGAQMSAPVTVTINVTDTIPQSNPQTWDTPENTALVVNAASGVLTSAWDDDGDTLTAQRVGLPSHGSVQLNGDGSFTYTPNSGYFGTDSFTYQTTDTAGLSTSAPATVTINVGEVIADNLSNSVPSAVVVADFNGDGNPDVAMADKGLNTVSVYLDGSNGVMATPTSTTTVGSAPVALAAGDFNGDGKMDLAVANSVSNSVSILLGNGDGTFTTGTTLTGFNDPVALAVGDFNGDGKVDLAVINKGSNSVSILLGNGNGTFAAGTSLTTGSSPTSIAAADFNNDSKTDLVVTNSASNTVSVFLGNGNGTFATPLTDSVGTAPASVTTGDFNGDGFQDLAVANNGSNDLSVLLGNGDGTFLAPKSYAAGSNPVGVVAGVFDSNGAVNIVVADNGANNLTLLFNDGDGSFAAPEMITTPGVSAAIAMGHFTQSGQEDVVAAYEGPEPGDMVVYGTATAAAAPAAPFDFKVINPKTNKADGEITVTMVNKSGGASNVDADFHPSEEGSKQDKIKTLADLQKAFGVNHFQWYQVAKMSMEDKKAANYVILYGATSGKPLGSTTFVDPPAGGLTSGNKNGEGAKTVEQWADSLPWFWDEAAPPAKLTAAQKGGWSNDLLLQNEYSDKNEAPKAKPTDAIGLHYQDKPKSQYKKQILFSTWLVGIDSAGKPIWFAAGFSWGWSNLQDVNNPAVGDGKEITTKPDVKTQYNDLIGAFTKPGS